MFLTVPIAMALVAATLLAPIKRGALFYRMSLFLPYVLPSVVTAIIWRTLMNPDSRSRRAVDRLGHARFRQGISGRSQHRAAGHRLRRQLALVGFPDGAVPGLDAEHPADLYEAARLDGANRWQEFRDVTIPGIRPTLVFMILMTSIWSFLTFDYIWILTQGGPAGASEVLAVLVLKNAFMNFEAGYAAAIGLTMSCLRRLS